MSIMKYIVAGIFAFSTSVAANDEQEIQKEIYSAFPEEPFKEILTEVNALMAQQREPEKQEKQNPEKYAGRGPARGLYYLQVVGVESEKHSYEDIDDYLFTTTFDHGGKIMRAWTFELGYAHSPYATIKGKKVQQSDEIRVCENYSGILMFCKPGLSIIGYFKQWKLDGYQNGVFQYQSTSIDSPWKTLTDRLTIR